MTFLSKDLTAAVSPAKLLTTRVLVTVLGRALAVFVTVSLLMHKQLTGHFELSGLNLVSATRESGTPDAASAATTLGDAVPVLTILVVSGVLAPVRWGSGWRLLVLPFASAALAYVIAFSIQIAISIQIALSIQQAMASLAMLIGASRIVLGMQESPQ